jgi:hypothetical protein
MDAGSPPEGYSRRQLSDAVEASVNADLPVIRPASEAHVVQIAGGIGFGVSQRPTLAAVVPLLASRQN